MYTADRALFDRWIADAREGRLDDCAIAELAETLASSGQRLERRPASADLASTGGPGSISTLWSPAAIAAHGSTVAKLGVPGRPAGGVDVLMQVDGYRTALNAAEAEAVIESCGYVHLLAGCEFAPADAEMFAYRQEVDAQHVPALAIASLLSKKLVTGTSIVGLEVRIAPHGNLGANREEAERNARRFCSVARLLGITGVCFLTDATTPQQPYLGRGEALAALSHLLAGTECDWLADHARQCELWSNMLVGGTRPLRIDVSRVFAANIEAQGGTLDALHSRAKTVIAAHSRTVTARNEGIVRYDLGKLRHAILTARRSDKEQAFDDSAGVIILVQPNSKVSHGEPLISVRCSDAAWPILNNDVSAAIHYDHAESGAGELSGTASVEVIRV